MDRQYGGQSRGTRPGALRLADTFKTPGMCIDAAGLGRGELFILGPQTECSYEVKPGAVACELSLTLENIRDLRDEFQAELDRRLGL